MNYEKKRGSLKWHSEDKRSFTIIETGNHHQLAHHLMAIWRHFCFRIEDKWSELESDKSPNMSVMNMPPDCNSFESSLLFVKNDKWIRLCCVGGHWNTIGHNLGTQLRGKDHYSFLKAREGLGLTLCLNLSKWDSVCVCVCVDQINKRSRGEARKHEHDIHCLFDGTCLHSGSEIAWLIKKLSIAMCAWQAAETVQRLRVELNWLVWGDTDTAPTSPVNPWSPSKARLIINKL